MRRRRALRLLAPALVAAALAAPAATPSAAFAVPAASAPAPERAAAAAKQRTVVRSYVDLRRKYRGARIPESFQGVSLEFSQVPNVLGAPVANAPLIGFLRDLGAGGAGPPVVRFGGGTTENVWYSAGDDPFPAGIYHRLLPAQLRRIGAELAQAGAKAIMGINITYPETTLHTDLATAVRDLVGADNLMALELGNEPGLYPERYWYTDAEGRDHTIRSPGWGIPDYLDEVSQVGGDLRAAGIRIPLAGPATDPRDEWVKAIPRFVRRVGDGVGMVSVHDYSLSNCDAGDGPDEPRMILSDGPRIGSAKRVKEAIEVVRDAGLALPVRVTETNSASCGGIEGASDRFAAALWGLDHLFSMAVVGAAGVNFHASSQHYQPFGIVRDGQGVPYLIARPLAYAMKVFADATRNRPRLIPTSYFAERPRRGAVIHTWGLHDTVADQVRVVTVYKRGSGAGAVDIRIPRGAPTAQLRRLTARSVQAASGITWAGRSYPPVSTDGLLPGEEAVETVQRRKRSRYRFRMVPGTATMLTVDLR